jgi:Inner membrane protein YgaP-like, transmembrane domain
MKVNEGTLDRALRVIVGALLLGLTMTGKIGMWGWIGLVPLVTGGVGLCPLYSVLGLSTCPTRKN